MKTILIQYLRSCLQEYVKERFTKENVKAVLEKVYAQLKAYAESNNYKWDDAVLSAFGFLVLDDDNIDKFIDIVISLVNGKICASTCDPTIAEEIAPLFAEWAK